MKVGDPRRHGRRKFLGSLVGGAAATMLVAPRRLSAGTRPPLLAGEGVVDITPPLGIEMGGFHRPPGNERRIRAVRQPSAARALVLSMGDVQAAICSVDVACFSEEAAHGIRRQVAQATGIAADHVRVCATHTHSMPGFCFLRQWGAIPEDYMAVVQEKTVEAVRLAKEDLAPTEVSLGKARAVGGNHNRTTQDFSRDDQFDKTSTDSKRWLDTTLHALLLERAGAKRPLLWYHFSAHCVCFADEQAGPDWPGMVAELTAKNEKLWPSFLQGHCGDVNPGDGKDWRGEANQTVGAIYPALQRALANVKRVKVDRLRSQREPFGVPVDVALFGDWLRQYARDPSKCSDAPWVDAEFARAWYQDNSKRELPKQIPITLSALQLGEVGLVFHPAELYSYYGLAIRRDSPLPETLVVGYADGILGYLTDPNAYKAGEYAAIVVPKILDLGPFVPTAAEQMTAGVLSLLKRTAG